MISLRTALFGFALGLGIAACGDDGSTMGETEAPTCEHGSFSPCTCTDGSMGMQMCAHDSSGFQACMCDGDLTSGTTGSVVTSDGTASSDEEGNSTGPLDGGSSSSSGGVEGSSSSGEPVGEPPTAQINHPGDGEMRQVDVPIPFIGVAMDAEDGALSGASMVWASDVEGMIGQGETFDAPLTMLGMHVITLTATDSDGNTAEDSITLEIIP